MTSTRRLFLVPCQWQLPVKFLKKGGQFRSICNRKTKEIDYLAQVIVHRLKEETRESGTTIHVNLRPTNRMRDKGEKPPFAEEIFQWFAQFISGDSKISISEHGDSVFPLRQYESVFSLPLRLSGTLNYTGSAVFENSQMVGVRVLPRSNQVGVTSMVQEIMTRKGISVTLRRHADAD